MCGKHLVIWAICALMVFGSDFNDDFDVEDCGSQLGELKRFKIRECSKDSALPGKCIIRRNNNATVEIDFISFKRDFVYAYPRGVMFRLNIPLPTKLSFLSHACVFGDLVCPLKENQEHHYVGHWCTWNMPQFEVLIKWYLMDSANKTVVCVQMPAIFR